MFDKIIVDADLCIKLGSSGKYRFLAEVLPLIADNICIHRYTFSEVLAPASAKDQLNELIASGKLLVVDERQLEEDDRKIFSMTYNKLASVMINPDKPNKNRGEVCALAYAKTTGIPIFATDEKDLQQIIDTVLNTGIEDDIQCKRIEDLVLMIRDSHIEVARKTAKRLWIIAGKEKERFDTEIWPC